MAEDRRKDAATASTGAVLLAGGGALRHAAVRRAYPGKAPRIHGLAMLHHAPRGKRQFWTGSVIGALGLPPLAVGTSRLVRGDVDKADDKRGFWREGIRGSGEALKARAESYHEPVPVKLRAAQLGVGAGVGALGSLAARAALGRRGKALKPLLTPVAGGLAATASVPLSNHYVSRKHPEYEITPAGVRRRKTPIKMPSTKSSQYRPQPRNFARDVGKRYLGVGAWSSTKPMLTQLRNSKAVKIHRFDNQVATERAMAQLRNNNKRSTTRGLTELRQMDPKQVYAVRKSDNRFATRRAERLADSLYAQGRHPEALRASLVADNHLMRTSALKSMHEFRMDRLAKHKRETAMERRRQGLPWSFPKRGFVRKAAGYQGSRTPYIRQRAAITAAGHPPVIGPFTSSAAAARYAPPGQGRKAATRQFLMGSGAGLPIGAVGAYAGAHLTARSKTAEGIATDVANTKHAVHGAVRRAAGLPEKAEKGPGALTRRFLASGAGKPFRTKAGAVGGAAGFIGAKMASGGVLGQTAITLNQRDQKRYNAKHNITKAAGPGQTKREQHTLAQRKRRSAVLQTVGGVASLGSLGLLAAGQRGPALTLGTIGSGVGGTNALLGARVQRQEAHAVDPVKKNLSGGLVAVRKSAGPLEIHGSKREHHELIRTYGDRGPLPKNLDRDTRMKTWEARYAHHGGQRQNTYARRAQIGEGVKNIGLATATAGGAAWLATRGKRGTALAAKHPKLRHKAETVAGAGATVGGAGEMLAGWAHHRQSSYANSPGGVAASALRRMRDNTPDSS